MAGAFFAGESWPERVWEVFRAVTQGVDENPALAHVVLIESYAAGPGATQRLEDNRAVFTVFLREGYRYQSEGAPPSSLALEAIVTTIFEIAYLQTRKRGKPKTARLLAPIAHLCLTPFTGPEQANELIDTYISQDARGA
jgi:hypothetical protein